MTPFTVRFSNYSLSIKDIITYNTTQQETIQNFVMEKTIEDIRTLGKSGVKVPLERPRQITQILARKNSIMRGKDDQEILNKSIVLFEGHIIDRILLRMDNSGLTVARTDILISLIGRLRITNEVDNQAEFKGHPSLVFTYFEISSSDNLRISISFKKDGRIMKGITLTNVNVDKLVAKVSESLSRTTFANLQAFREKLIKEMGIDND